MGLFVYLGTSVLKRNFYPHSSYRLQFHIWSILEQDFVFIHGTVDYLYNGHDGLDDIGPYDDGLFAWDLKPSILACIARK